MKRVLRYPILSTDFTLSIQVELECYAESVAASMISPNKDEVDAQALSDYYAFIDEAVLEIEDHDLIILERSDSKSSKTSRYFTIADLEQNVCGTMKFVIFLRISNHTRTEDEDILRWIRDKRDTTAEYLGVKWKVRDVLVNNVQFANYDDAVEYIGKKAAEYSQTLKGRNRQSNT